MGVCLTVDEDNNELKTIKELKRAVSFIYYAFVYV